MKIRPMTEKEINSLVAKPVKAQSEIVFSEIETDESCLCMDCKDHASVVILLEDGEEVERVSNCCGAPIWEW